MNISSNIKACIFDMDGLLIDSEPFWEKADAKFFANHDKKHSPEINKHIMGMGHKQIIQYFKDEYAFEGDNEDLIKERVALFYELFLKEISSMDGAVDLVTKLHDKNIPLAIATSGHTAMKANELLEKLHIATYFKLFITGYDVKNSKPAPDIYLKTAEELKVDPSHCLVFEDAPNGVKAGKAAGMSVFGVNKDKAIYAKLKEAGADKVFYSLTEVSV